MIERTARAEIKPLSGKMETGVDKEALKKACQQFEGMFMHQILKGMRKTVAEGELLHGGNAEKIFVDLKDQAVSDELAQAGGLGLAEMLYRQLLGPEGEDSSGRTDRTLESYQQARPASPEAQTREPEDAPDTLVMPVRGRLTSGFGMRVHPLLQEERMHHGIDLAAPEGTSIKAAAPGRVSFSGWVRGYGNLVEVDHGEGLITRYGHNSQNLVRAGDEIKAGQVLAKVGSTGQSTGPHLHFEVRRDGSPVNPYALLDQNRDPERKTAEKPSSKTTYQG